MGTSKKEIRDKNFSETSQDYARTAEAEFLEGISRSSGRQEESLTVLSVGARIKAVRETKSLTLKDVAQRTGFSESAIAQIESGEILPPLGDMVKLARALEMKMGYLLVQGESKPYTVVLKKNRKPVSRYGSQKTIRYGYTYESLAPEKKERNMEPFLVTLEPTSQDEPPSTHDGEEFIFVLEGEIEVILGQNKEVLSAEDSIYYDSTLPHRVRALGDQNARIVAVLYTQEK
ncbi:MAG: cupin domain-containing protein [Deltaproteobacteria bacterium]|nr:cupin domain-containing protein [Deltaproteobacteria bacterium]